MRNWRKMTWVLIIWCALMLIWLVSYGGEIDSASEDCAQERGQLAQDACEAGTEIGGGIGVGVILAVAFFGFVFLSIIWFMTRPRGRDCPACGELVKKGQTRCEKCGHDMASGLQAAAPPPPPHQVPAGWYPAPEGDGTQGYWDGSAWTEHRAPAAGPTE
jgi:hypothetical protein